MIFREKIWTYLAVVLGVPILVFALVSWYESHVSGLPVLGPENHKVGNFNFINQHGKHINLQHWNDKIVVANFFFTHCPVVCPKMTANLKIIQAKSGSNVSFNSFTVDPQRDSVSRFVFYAHRFNINPTWNLLTGSKKHLYRFARKDLMIVATDGDGGPEDFIHSENLVLIDPEKRIRGYYRGTNKSDAEQLLLDIQKLKKEYHLE